MSYYARVAINECGGQINIGIYDPERFKQEDGSRTGGAAFAEDAEVYISEWSGGAPESGIHKLAEVSMASCGSADTDKARRRMDVLEQCIEVAEFINQALLDGFEWPRIASAVRGLLTGDFTERMGLDSSEYSVRFTAFVARARLGAKP